MQLGAEAYGVPVIKTSNNMPFDLKQTKKYDGCT